MIFPSFQTFIVIPKTPVDAVGDHTRYWRLCFHPYEQLVISRGQTTECVRPVIRLLKVHSHSFIISGKITKTNGFFEIAELSRLPQGQTNSHIYSYALKSVVMNMILERPSKVWDRANIQDHFLEVCNAIVNS